MTQAPQTEQEQRGLANVKRLIGAAIAAVLVSITAGLILLLAEPASGSNTEAALGLAAAIGGLATAGFVVAAMVYAQAKNLWRFAPMWIRVVAWIFIAYAIVATVWNFLQNVV